MYDGIEIPFACNKCGFKESDRHKMPRDDLWWSKDTRGTLDTYYKGNVLILRGDSHIKDGHIRIYMECPNCKNMINARAHVVEDKLTGEFDYGAPSHGKYYD